MGAVSEVMEAMEELAVINPDIIKLAVVTVAMGKSIVNSKLTFT